MSRRGDWMQTYTGRQFWPLDPRADEVLLEDIAHALSNQCRYAGHVRRFYSVAEHSVRLARHFAGTDLARPALLHDAAEAYLVDLPRPVKHSVQGYAEAERRLERVIAEHFGLDWPWPAAVMEADTAILHDEAAQLMAPPAAPWNLPGGPLGIGVAGWPPLVAETEFLTAFDALWSGRASRPAAPDRSGGAEERG